MAKIDSLGFWCGAFLAGHLGVPARAGFGEISSKFRYGSKGWSQSR
jgi:hypothetical protein